jgi:putative transcriptional regulator
MISDVITIKLDELLERRDMSLYRVQKDTGLAYNALLRIRHGEVTDIKLSTVEKLCKSLDCELGDLITFSDS